MRLAAVLTAVFLGIAAGLRGQERPVSLEIGAGVNAFGDDLLRVLDKDAEDPSGNLVFSPVSISTVFAMLQGGARGETAAEIQRVMHFPVAGEELHNGHARLAESLRISAKSCTIHTANALFPQRGYPLLPDFRELLATQYRAESRELDFARNMEGARKEINGWIEERTERCIREMLGSGDLDAETRFVLVNAVYFKARWRQPFDKRETAPQPFHPVGRAPYRVATMRMRDEEFLYLENAQVQVLELPYVGGRFSMVILLPKRRDGLAEVTKRFCDNTLGVDLRDLKPTLVTLSLPKFTIKGPTTNLIAPLRKLGMRRLFDERQADLGGMSAEKPLWIDLAIHKAWIRVDEEGTEAAAATIGAGMGGGPPEVVEFRADHPFLFVIRDRLTGAALFIGRLVAPPPAQG